MNASVIKTSKNSRLGIQNDILDKTNIKQIPNASPRFNKIQQEISIKAAAKDNDITNSIIRRIKKLNELILIDDITREKLNEVIATSDIVYSASSQTIHLREAISKETDDLIKIVNSISAYIPNLSEFFIYLLSSILKDVNLLFDSQQHSGVCYSDSDSFTTNVFTKNLSNLKDNDLTDELATKKIVSLNSKYKINMKEITSKIITLPVTGTLSPRKKNVSFKIRENQCILSITSPTIKTESENKELEFEMVFPVSNPRICKEHIDILKEWINEPMKNLKNEKNFFSVVNTLSSFISSRSIITGNLFRTTWYCFEEVKVAMQHKAEEEFIASTKNIETLEEEIRLQQEQIQVCNDKKTSRLEHLQRLLNEKNNLLWHLEANKTRLEEIQNLDSRLLEALHELFILLHGVLSVLAITERTTYIEALTDMIYISIGKRNTLLMRQYFHQKIDNLITNKQETEEDINLKDKLPINIELRHEAKMARHEAKENLNLLNESLKKLCYERDSKNQWIRFHFLPTSDTLKQYHEDLQCLIAKLQENYIKSSQKLYKDSATQTDNSSLLSCINIKTTLKNMTANNEANLDNSIEPYVIYPSFHHLIKEIPCGYKETELKCLSIHSIISYIYHELIKYIDTKRQRGLTRPLDLPELIHGIYLAAFQNLIFANCCLLDLLKSVTHSDTQSSKIHLFARFCKLPGVKELDSSAFWLYLEIYRILQRGSPNSAFIKKNEEEFISSTTAWESLVFLFPSMNNVYREILKGKLVSLTHTYGLSPIPVNEVALIVLDLRSAQLQSQKETLKHHFDCFVRDGSFVSYNEFLKAVRKSNKSVNSAAVVAIYRQIIEFEKPSLMKDLFVDRCIKYDLFDLSSFKKEKLLQEVEFMQEDKESISFSFLEVIYQLYFYKQPKLLQSTEVVHSINVLEKLINAREDLLEAWNIIREIANNFLTLQEP